MPEAARLARSPADEATSPPSTEGSTGEVDLGAGVPLHAAARSLVEPSYGASLARVTVHTGLEAQAVLRAEGARAAAVGGRVAVRRDEYRPGTLRSDALIAHELAHVVQQGPRPTATTAPGPVDAEVEADRAAASAIVRSGRHNSEIRTTTGMDPTRIDAGPPTRPQRRGGLGLQRCTDDPEYGISRSGPAPTQTTEMHQGARPERLMYGSSIRYDSIVNGHHAVIDGDGDQSAELDLVFRAGARGQSFGQVDRMDVEATRLGNTPDRGGPGTESHQVSFDTSGDRFERSLHPRITQRTDGRSPTKIEATGGPYVNFTKMDIHPPAPEGDSATYRMELTKPVGYGEQTTTETHPVTFSRDPSDIYPVFMPGTPRRAGPIWVVDVEVGRYGDRFRFTFRRHGSAGTVRMGISPMAGATPIGASQMDVPITGALDVRIARNLGPFLELDLNGDGRADIRLYERMEPRANPRTGSGLAQPDQFRSLTITVTNGDGSHEYGRASRNVSDGEYDEDAVHLENEFETFAAASAPEAFEAAAGVPDLASDLAGVVHQLNELRQTAVTAGQLSAGTLSSYDALVKRWVAAAAAPGPTGSRVRNREAAAAARSFDATWSAETTAGTTSHRVYPMGRSTDVNEENEFTGYSRTFENRGMGLTEWVTTATFGERLAEALDHDDRHAGAAVMVRINAAMGRWVAHQLREGGHEQEATRVESLSALSQELDALTGRPTTRAVAVYHSAPEYAREGVPSSIPLRLYYWREGSTWYLKDLTHPTRNKSTALLEEDGGTDTEPPHALFAKLNDEDRYPKGSIQYELPDGGRAAVVAITHPWKVSTVLSWISLALAATALVAGLVLSGGTAAPVIVPALWALSAGVGAASAAAHMVEEADQGRLGDAIALDTAQIIASLAGVGALTSRAIQAFRLGRTVAAARATGSAVTALEAANLAPIGAAGMRLLLITQIAADSVQVVLMGAQLAEQLQQIAASDMSDADKLRARVLAIGQFGLMAGLSYVSVRATAAEVRQSLQAGGELIQAGQHTLVPGIYRPHHYQLELDAVVSRAGRTGMAPEPVRVVHPREAGSSLALARIEMVDGRPQLVVVDGAPLHVVREEAIHLDQLALASRPRAGLTEAERRIQRAGQQVINAQGRWARLTPTQRVQAHQARLVLEEDAQLRLLQRYQGELDAGRPVSAIDVDNAWQNLENLRRAQADLADAEGRVRRGTALGDIDSQLDTAPVLYNKQTVPETSLDESWRTLEPGPFILAYRQRYPNTTLTDVELTQRHAMSKRLSPVTGRLVDASRRVPDVRARYAEGDPEVLRMRGQSAEQLSHTEQSRIDALLAQRDVARAERDAAATGAPPDVNARNLAQHRVNEASRELGELAGAMWVRRRYAGPPAPQLVYPTGGGSRPGDFDQVWRCTVTENGTQRTVWIVVEAKGGASTLGSRRAPSGVRAEQGTRVYFDDITRLMGEMGGEARDAATHIRTASADSSQSIRYVLVQAPIGYAASASGTGTSQLGDISVREFDITPTATTPSTTGTAAP